MQNLIIEAIKFIRQKKNRPSPEAIFRYVNESGEDDITEFKETIINMINDELIQNRGREGNISYFLTEATNAHKENPIVYNSERKGDVSNLNLADKSSDHFEESAFSQHDDKSIEILEETDSIKFVEHYIDEMAVKFRKGKPDIYLLYERMIIELKAQIDLIKSSQLDTISILKEEINYIRNELQSKNDLIATLLSTQIKLANDSTKSQMINENGNKNMDLNQISENLFYQSQSNMLTGISETHSVKGNLNTASIKKYVPTKLLNQNKQSGGKDDDTSRPYFVEVIGDSHLNAINENGLNSKERNRKVKVRRWPGGSVEDMCDLVKPALRNNPNEIIIHAGSNDMPKPSNVMRDFKTLTNFVKEHSPDVKLTISSIMVRNDFNGIHNKINEINAKLRNYCDQNDLGFIDNSNIDESFLGQYKLHMSKAGTSMLAKNILNHMNQG